METTTLFAISFILMACMAVGMTFGVVDYTQRLTKALANGAAAASTAGIDLGHGSTGRLLADMEFIVEAPAMNVTEMPDAKTMIYSIETDDDAAFGSPTVVNAALLTQNGVGGAGCAAQTKRFRLPTNCERYVRIKATGSASGNATTATMAFRAVY